MENMWRLCFSSPHRNVLLRNKTALAIEKRTTKTTVLVRDVTTSYCTPSEFCKNEQLRRKKTISMENADLPVTRFQNIGKIRKMIRNDVFMISHHSGFGPNKYGSTSSAYVDLSSSTLPKTNSSPLEIGWAPKGNSSTNH